MPSPLPPHVVSLVLQYIAPPSAITQPLPPHILSKPLLQRHHFLAIFPDDAQDYLCWPSSSSDVGERVVALLEDLPRVDPEDALYPTQYASDTESTYAHVHVPSGLPSDGDGGLRLVFQLDGDEWKYHDAALMPFPANTRPDIEPTSVISLPVPQNPWSNGHSERAPEGPDTTLSHDDDDDDEYWNSYGAQDADGEEELGPQRTRNAASEADTHQSEEAAEAAYWAQYSSVHGTADSTIPSPLPTHHRKILQPQVHPAGNTEPRVVHFPPRDIPEPHTLSSLLSNVSRRQSYIEPYSLPTSPPPENNDESTPDGNSSDGSSEDTKILSPIKAQQQQFSDGQVSELKTPIFASAPDGVVDAALRASITGIYQLWKSSKSDSGQTEQERKEEFAKVVRDMVLGTS